MEIKMVNCPNGHYYNAALHAVCPECGLSGGVYNGPAGGAGNFGKTEAVGGGMGNFGKTEALGGGVDNFGKTEAPQAAGMNGGYNAPSAAFGAQAQPAAEPSLADPFGHTTIGGEEYGASSNADRIAPVVGWLVCIEGPLRGTDFRVHNGYNYIGRDEGDIHIQGDKQVSRRNHAMVAFDNTERIYYVGPAEGRNLIKVNGKTVMSPVELKSYDVISIGTTKMMFVALCGPHFGWEGDTAE